MKHLILIACIIGITFQACEKNSPQYKCGELLDNKCLIFEEKTNTFFLQNCPSDQTCFIHNDINMGSCINKLRYKLQGQKCSISAECYSKQCVDGFCVSLTNDVKCDSSFQCEPLSFCSSEKTTNCILLLTEGSNCNKDEDCQIGFACGAKAEKVEKKCVKLFSIPKGQYSSNRLLCDTGFLYPNKGNYDPFDTSKQGGTCASSKLVSNYEICNNDKDCKYSVNAGGGDLPLFEGNCQCSSNGVFGYCAITTDNDKWTNWMNQYKRVLTKYTTDNKQHVAQLRQNNYDDFLLMQAEIEVVKYQLLKHADECAIRYFSSSEFIGVTFTLISSLVLLLF